MKSFCLPGTITANGLSFLAAILGGALCCARASEPDALPMILELLGSPDRDTRGLGLQQVREGFPGEAATRKLTEQLPSLSPEGQSALLEALGDRGDPTARPAIVRAVASPIEIVRKAALGALGRVAQPSDVPLLSEKAANGSPLERETAQRSLVRLRGDSMDAALITLLGEAAPGVRAELLQVLAARKVAQAGSAVLRQATNSHPAVRIAALAAAQTLVDPSDTETLIHMVASAADDRERTAAEAALLALSARGRERCLDAVLAAIPNATTSDQITLLQALAAIGGPKALATIAQNFHVGTPSVQDEALRLLSEWPDPGAESCLLKIAGQTTNAVHQVLAIRGLVRIGSAQEKRPANLPLLRTVWQLTRRPEEKRLVLGALGACATPEALTLAAQALDDRDLAEEAALATVLIAEKLPSVPSESRQALEKARERSNDVAVRERADKVLQRMRAQ
jgi:HEAT repeat protein